MSIRWRGKMVPTKNAKLMEAILVAKHAADQLDAAGNVAAEAKMELFDKVIGAFWDATRIAETDVKEDAVGRETKVAEYLATGPDWYLRQIATAKVKSSKSDENTANLQFALGYVSYLRVSRTIQRNLLLIQETQRKLAQPDVKDKKAAKPEDAVKLHDTIIQVSRFDFALTGFGKLIIWAGCYRITRYARNTSRFVPTEHPDRQTIIVQSQKVCMDVAVTVEQNLTIL